MFFDDSHTCNQPGGGTFQRFHLSELSAVSLVHLSSELAHPVRGERYVRGSTRAAVMKDWVCVKECRFRAQRNIKVASNTLKWWSNQYFLQFITAIRYLWRCNLRVPEQLVKRLDLLFAQFEERQQTCLLLSLLLESLDSLDHARCAQWGFRALHNKCFSFRFFNSFS